VGLVVSEAFSWKILPFISLVIKFKFYIYLLNVQYIVVMFLLLFP
jgi:hypothetical protein